MFLSTLPLFVFVEWGSITPYTGALLFAFGESYLGSCFFHDLSFSCVDNTLSVPARGVHYRQALLSG